MILKRKTLQSMDVFPWNVCCVLACCVSVFVGTPLDFHIRYPLWSAVGSSLLHAVLWFFSASIYLWFTK